MNNQKKHFILTLVFLCGCYSEFDLGARTPRKDPCTNIVEHEYVYVMPTCRNVQPLVQ